MGASAAARVGSHRTRAIADLHAARAYTVGTLQIVHLDLYRLRSEDELANLGLRDWLAEARSWTLVEWPERAPKLAERCDLILDFRFIGPSARSVTFTAATQAGRDAFTADRDLDSK